MSELRFADVASSGTKFVPLYSWFTALSVQILMRYLFCLFQFCKALSTSRISTVLPLGASPSTAFDITPLLILSPTFSADEALQHFRLLRNAIQALLKNHFVTSKSLWLYTSTLVISIWTAKATWICFVSVTMNGLELLTFIMKVTSFCKFSGTSENVLKC